MGNERGTLVTRAVRDSSPFSGMVSTPEGGIFLCSAEAVYKYIGGRFIPVEVERAIVREESVWL